VAKVITDIKGRCSNQPLQLGSFVPFDNDRIEDLLLIGSEGMIVRTQTAATDGYDIWELRLEPSARRSKRH
jgi:hypothetical protein